jgi:hypothetical protein
LIRSDNLLKKLRGRGIYGDRGEKRVDDIRVIEEVVKGVINGMYWSGGEGR